MLGLFWAFILGAVAVGAGVLAVLGPPRVVAGAVLAGPPRRDANNNTPWPGPPHMVLGRPIADPDPQLLEPAPDFSGRMLPRVGPTRRAPMRAYAAGFDSTDPHPRLALLVAGLGLYAADSLAAVTQLPPAVDFAVSPYADKPEALLAAMRAAGHEFLLSLPMEPENYPDDDEGQNQLLTSATAAENVRNLEWALCRFGGYVGVTGASDGQLGERYAASADLIGQVETELSARGLFYIDPRPGADVPARAAGRGVDLLIDAPPDAGNIDSRLGELTQIARQHGLALGLVAQPSPVAVARIAAWSARLAAEGVTLVPVSALVQPAPAGAE